MFKFCETHLEENGAHDSEIVSMVQAQPGWQLAAVDKDGTLYVEPVLAWAIIDEHKECGCRARSVRPLTTTWDGADIAHDHFEVELGDPCARNHGRGTCFRSALVPPGHRPTVQACEATIGPSFAIEVVPDGAKP